MKCLTELIIDGRLKLWDHYALSSKVKLNVSDTKIYHTSPVLRDFVLQS